MAENSRIEWTDHTFNPWIGCTKVSPACDHCYAERLATTRLGVAWGPRAPRRRTAESTWRQPLSWDRKAAREGVRRRVFCASLADVFDNAVPEEWRDRLWLLIKETRHLDWLLLTKRPQNITRMLPKATFTGRPWGDGWPNVWLGTTVENQAAADERIPHLLMAPARVRFLSCEPLLGPLDLRQWLGEYGCPCGWGGSPMSFCEACGWRGYDASYGEDCPACHEGLSDWNACPECERHDQDGSDFGPNSRHLRWVIAGGESGPGARPMHPDWARALRDQCREAGVPFFFKQWGAYVPARPVYPSEDRTWAEQAAARAFGPGTRPEDVDLDAVEGIEDFMREFPDLGVLYRNGHFYDGIQWQPHVRFGCWWMERVGKKRAGALLDGREHREFPEAAERAGGER